MFNNNRVLLLETKIDECLYKINNLEINLNYRREDLSYIKKQLNEVLAQKVTPNIEYTKLDNYRYPKNTKTIEIVERMNGYVLRCGELFVEKWVQTAVNRSDWVTAKFADIEQAERAVRVILGDNVVSTYNVG